jgi:DNA-binding transcriptional ArsR family regulator
MHEKQNVKKKQILEILSKSPEPLRESELAKRIGTGRNVIHYHLKKLTDSGIVTSKEKRYSLDEKSTVVEGIVKVLAEKECNFVELQDIGFDKHHIRNALSLLEGEGRIYKKYPKVIVNESRDVRYALTPFAYSELGICPICKKNIDPSDEVITTALRTPPAEFRTVSIHAKCYHGGEFGRECCCAYCGLPISPKLMDRRRIDHHSISDHFYKVELDTISFLRDLQLMLNSFNRSHSHPSNFENRMECNAKIKQHYTDSQKQYNVGDIPKWILESMKSEEEREARNSELDSEIVNSIEITRKIADSKESKEIRERLSSALKPGKSTEAIEALTRDWSEFDSKTGESERIEKLIKLIPECYGLPFPESTSGKIRNELEMILPPSDLSYLDQAEEFITGIIKYREKLPEDYDIKSRIKEIWSAAQELRKENERTIRTMYEKLLGPSGCLYTQTSPTWAVARDHHYERFYDDLTAERPRRWSLSEYYLFHSTALAYQHDDKIYHPYCAEKLGLTNTSYCINNNNKKLKGGDITE